MSLSPEEELDNKITELQENTLQKKIRNEKLYDDTAELIIKTEQMEATNKLWSYKLALNLFDDLYLSAITAPFYGDKIEIFISSSSTNEIAKKIEDGIKDILPIHEAIPKLNMLYRKLNFIIEMVLDEEKDGELINKNLLMSKFLDEIDKKLLNFFKTEVRKKIDSD